MMRQPIVRKSSTSLLRGPLLVDIVLEKLPETNKQSLIKQWALCERHADDLICMTDNIVDMVYISRKFKTARGHVQLAVEKEPKNNGTYRLWTKEIR